MAGLSRTVIGLSLLSVGGCGAFLLRWKRRSVVPPPSYVSRTGQEFPLETPRWCEESENGEPLPLMLTRLPGITRQQIRTGVRSLWRYAASFPMECDEPISLGEGCTPLVKRPFAGSNSVSFKCEWNNPTCSFKDRGTTVMLSLLRQQGITRVLEDSSGNGGASVACYAAAGGLQAIIMAPDSTSPAKTVQMQAHGASVELIPGSRQATADAAVASHGRGGNLFYASHNWHPFFLQGTKTIAYEMWEDLGFSAPTNVIIPSGAGSNILGCDIGFSELLARGEISSLPKLFCAQPLLCSPIASAILDELGEDDGQAPACGGMSNPRYKGAPPAEAWNLPEKTIAEGTSIAKPVRLEECVDAVVRSEGGAVRVPEARISEAMLELARVGLYTEPTCATAAAAYQMLLESGRIGKDEVSVVILTSTGVKATPSVAKLMGLPTE